MPTCIKSTMVLYVEDLGNIAEINTVCGKLCAICQILLSFLTRMLQHHINDRLDFPELSFICSVSSVNLSKALLICL